MLHDSAWRKGPPAKYRLQVSSRNVAIALLQVPPEFHEDFVERLVALSDIVAA